MKQKIITLISIIGLLLLTLGFEVQSIQAQTNEKVIDSNELYVPAIIGEHLAIPLEISATNSSSLPAVIPSWADFVNKELVSNDGQGVYIAVLDTGLLPPWPFFFSQANIAWNLGKGFTHELKWDDTVGDIVAGPLKEDRGFITDLASGHGTHVASTIVGFNVNNQFRVTGIAPKATIIPVLVLDGWIVEDTPFGRLNIEGGTEEMIAAGINYIADLTNFLDGRVVINMSLGGPVNSPLIEDAVNNAISKGVIVVASAGNEGTDGMGYPGALPQVISAAAGGWTDWYNMGWAADVPEALNTRDSLGNNWQIYLETFSSRPNKDLGQKHKDLDVTAPGAAILGPFKPPFESVIGYFYLWGTSMASPHVASTAAAGAAITPANKPNLHGICPQKCSSWPAFTC